MSSVEIAKGSARGSLILVLGNVASTAIAAAAIVVIARLLGPSAYGLYTLALVVPSILVLVGDMGVSSSVNRYAPYYLSRGETARAATFIKRAIVITLTLGFMLSVVNYVSAPYLSVTLFHRPSLVPLMELCSALVIGQTLATTMIHVFVGWNAITKVSALSVLQPGLKIAVSSILILSGLGVYGALAGHVASVLVEGGAGIVLFLAMKSGISGGDTMGFASDLKLMLGYGFPLFVGGLATGVASQYLTVFLASIASNSVVGYYQAAVNLSVAITLISGAIGTILFRSFAALDGIRSDFVPVFTAAVKYVSYVLTPVVFFLITSAPVLVDVLYTKFFSPTSSLVQLIAVANLPVILGMTVVPSFLSGVGKSKAAMAISLTAAVAWVAAGVSFGLFLGLGVEGIILASLFSNVLSAALGLYLSYRYYRVRMALRSQGGILASSVVAWGVALFIPQGVAPPLLTLLIDLGVFAVVYLTTVPLLRGVDRVDLDRLVVMTGDIQFVGMVAKKLLEYEMYIMRISSRAATR